jgi:hypothetical protein
MTTTQLTTTVRTPAPTTRPSVRRVAARGAVASLAGALALLAYGAAAIAVHGPMQAGDPGASKAVPLNAASFSIGVLFSSFAGVLVAVAVARWAKRPARTFGRAAAALTAVSLFFPLAASHTDEATRLVLAGGHLVAAAVIIPAIVQALR